MKIYVPQFRFDEPTDVAGEYDPAALDLELVDLRYLEPLRMKGVVIRGREVVEFRGCLTSRVRRTCGRTLKEVDEDLQVSFDLYYPVEGQAVIDTENDLREAVLLEQPMVFYASDEDVGYTDRDSLSEEERAERQDNPFGKLKQFKDRFKEE